MNTRFLSLKSALVAIGLPVLLAVGAEAAEPPAVGRSGGVNTAEPDDGTAAGRAALVQRDYDAARPYFENALAAARLAGDQPRVADTLFYLGLTAQQSAASAPDPAASLATARRYYNDAITVRPNFPAALNNLAEVHLAENNPKGAGEALQRAMAAGGSREGVYAQKYADLLLREGKWKAACHHYAHAAGEQPDNEAVHRQLVEQCLKFDPPALIGYLWTLATQGQVLQVQRMAIEVLPRHGWSAEHLDEMMTIIAVCLSRQNYPPAEFPKTEAAALLRKLPSHPAIRELFELHQGERMTPNVYSWWAERIRRNSAPARLELWPQEAFRQLVCALGARWRPIAGGEEKAIAYYRLAAFLDPREPDPEALTRLAELYGSTERLGELTDVMNRHENEIFSAKGEAYRTDKLEKIYQFHSALGVIYSTMGVWGDDKTPTSAIFQLEQATKIAQRAMPVRPPRSPTSPGDSPVPTRAAAIKPAPQLVNLLADAYVRTNNPAKAFDLRVDKGAEFFRAGDTAAAREVLRDADKAVPASVSPVRKATFEKLQRDIPDLNTPRKSAQLRSTTPAAAVTSARAVGSLLPTNAPTTSPASLPASTPATIAAGSPAKIPAAVPASSAAVPAKLPTTSPATTAAATPAKLPVTVPASSTLVPAKLPATSTGTSTTARPAKIPATVPATAAASAAKVPATSLSTTPATSPALAAAAKTRVPLRVALASTPGVDTRKLAALTDMVKTLVAKPPGAAAVQALPREAIALNVQEIAVQGSKGRIIVQEGTKTMTVPFTIEGGDVPRSSSATRYVRK